MIQIVICDDQVVVREGIRTILSTTKTIEIVGMACDGEDALEVTKNTQPDLVLMDLKMPFMNGIQATRILKEQFPDIKVLVLTTYDDDEWVFDAIQSGADGYLLKDIPYEDLVKAITDTISGRTPVDSQIAGKLFKRVSQLPVQQKSSMVDMLSEREIEILRLISQGLSNAEIAEKLHLSEGTVRNHLTVLFSKLKVSDRTQAAVVAMRYGVIEF